MSTITLTSGFYAIKSKRGPELYVEWIQNIMSIILNCNLVIYTDDASFLLIHDVLPNNDRIKIVIKPLTDLYNYKYKEFWIKNHDRNYLLSHTSWELNMVWSEKLVLVKETRDNHYFPETELYGWCDIGYFRNRPILDIHTSNLTTFANELAISKLSKTQITYGCVNNNTTYINHLIAQIQNVNLVTQLPVKPIAPNQVSIASGFCTIPSHMIDYLFQLYDTTLLKYFNNDYLVKDDQMILATCIFSNLDQFDLRTESQPPYDNWFMFQRILH